MMNLMSSLIGRRCRTEPGPCTRPDHGVQNVAHFEMLQGDSNNQRAPDMTESSIRMRQSLH